MDKLFAMTSGKGGVGKSTVAAGLAAAFADKGEKVLLIDLDEGLRCLDLLLGVSEKVVCDLSDVLAGRDLRDALYTVPGHSSLFLIPAPLTAGQINDCSFGGFIRNIVHCFDRVILDFPAGIDFSLYRILPQTTVFLVVCTPDPVSVRDAAAIGRQLFEQEFINVRLMLNRFSYAYIKNDIYDGIDRIIDLSGLQLGGVIPVDNSLPVRQAAGLLPKKGGAFQAFTRISARFCGQKIGLPHPKKI